MTGKMKKRIAVAVFFILCGSLTACGSMSAEKLMAKAAKNAASMKSFEAESHMTIDMKYSTTRFTTKTENKMQVVTKTMESKSSSHIDMGTYGSYDMDTYVIKEGGDYWTYVKSMGNWTKQKLDAEKVKMTAESVSGQADILSYLDKMDSFMLVGEEQINGADTYKLEGVINGDKIGQLLEDIAKENALLDAKENNLTGFGSMTVTFWIDKKTKTPTKMYLDMTDIMKAVLTGESGIEISACRMEILYTGVNTVDKIVLPEEAGSAKEQ